jgi:hypothetical protein
MLLRALVEQVDEDTDADSRSKHFESAFRDAEEFLQELDEKEANN